MSNKCDWHGKCVLLIFNFCTNCCTIKTLQLGSTIVSSDWCLRTFSPLFWFYVIFFSSNWYNLLDHYLSTIIIFRKMLYLPKK